MCASYVPEVRGEMLQQATVDWVSTTSPRIPQPEDDVHMSLLEINKPQPRNYVDRGATVHYFWAASQRGLDEQ